MNPNESPENQAPSNPNPPSPQMPPAEEPQGQSPSSPPPSVPPEEPEMPQNTGKNNKSLRRWLVYSAILIVVIGAVVLGYFLFRQIATPVEKPRVKVGVLMAFTGGSSNMGYGMSKGMQLAKRQLGAENIELIQEDSKCEPNTAREGMERLIQQGVVAVIGDGCSSASVASLPLANNTKTIMVSPSASSTALSIPNDYFFRVIPNDNFQAEFLAQAMRDQGIQRVAVMYTNEPYGASMNKVFQEKFETLGGTVVATAYSEPDVINLDTQIKTLKDANPEAVFIAPNSVVTATAAINIARSIGLNVPLFGADIMYDDTIITNAPEVSEGLKVSTFSTGTDLFKQMLRNEYKVVEQLYAAPQAYDAFEAIYRAVENGAATGEEIKEYMPKIDFEGMSGHIKFDENGEIDDGTNRYDLLQVKNGEFVTIE